MVCQEYDTKCNSQPVQLKNDQLSPCVAIFTLGLIQPQFYSNLQGLLLWANHINSFFMCHVSSIFPLPTDFRLLLAGPLHIIMSFSLYVILTRYTVFPLMLCNELKRD
ncbi:hypothetical protein XENTR_v10018006 [Xenopus tropicalis]|nr:hypothetical protein XENTR_v10018006 [Xenopus tropicalis]